MPYHAPCLKIEISHLDEFFAYIIYYIVAKIFPQQHFQLSSCPCCILLPWKDCGFIWITLYFTYFCITIYIPVIVSVRSLLYTA